MDNSQLPLKNNFGPEELHKHGPVYTVKELRELLDKLPDRLAVNGESEDGVRLVWYNIGMSSEHLSVEENDALWDDDDEKDED